MALRIKTGLPNRFLNLNPIILWEVEGRLICTILTESIELTIFELKVYDLVNPYGIGALSARLKNQNRNSYVFVDFSNIHG